MGACLGMKFRGASGLNFNTNYLPRMLVVDPLIGDPVAAADLQLADFRLLPPETSTPFRQSL